MPKSFPAKEFILSSIIFIIAFSVFYFTELDLLISDYAFETTSFESCSVLSTLSLIGKLSGIIFACYLLKNVFVNSVEKSYRRKEAIFLISVLVIGPGLINNLVLKPIFNRPRPHEIQRYNETNDQQFVKVLLASSTEGKNSFPSGHAGSGFFFLAIWFIGRIRQKYGWKVFVPAFLWGGAVSVFRILEGQHFFSDCLSSLCVVYFTSFFICHFMGLSKSVED